MLKNHNKVKMPWGFGLDGKQSMNTKKILVKSLEVFKVLPSNLLTNANFDFSSKIIMNRTIASVEGWGWTNSFLEEDLKLIWLGF